MSNKRHRFAELSDWACYEAWPRLALGVSVLIALVIYVAVIDAIWRLVHWLW